jgi:hypothetical protein
MIAIDRPDVAIFEIIQQLLILAVAHVPSPDDFRGVDIRRVINPFVVYVMIYPICGLLVNKD